MSEEILQAIIIGAGPYGLALGRELQEKGIRFVILEGGERVGEQWRGRYDSLVLFTPRSYSALPGLQFGGDQRGYPTKDEVAAYLESYEKKFELPVVHDARVSHVSFHDKVFEVLSSRGAYHSKSVVLAVGAFQKPFTPTIPNDGSVKVLHSSEYRNTSSLRGSRILVVGAGNSGAQIAEELAGAGREVTIAARTMPRCVPREFLGRNFLWWFNLLGRLHAPAKGRKFNPLVGCSLMRRIKRGEIMFQKSELAGIRDGEVLFVDGTKKHFDAILWATGYVRDIGFVSSEAKQAPGFFELGEEQQPRRSSGLIVGASKDAQDIAQRIQKLL